MNTFKIALLFISVFALSSASAQNTASVEERMNQTLEQKRKKHTIEGAELGMLICEDANGNWKICSGDQFENILGFVTNVPYVTINKYPLSQKENRDVYVGFASFTKGKISKGDYLTAGADGKLIRCEKVDFPYAVAMEDASGEGQRISVKILGNRK